MNALFAVIGALVAYMGLALMRTGPHPVGPQLSVFQAVGIGIVYLAVVVAGGFLWRRGIHVADEEERRSQARKRRERTEALARSRGDA